MKDKQHDITGHVMQRIESGDVHMRSHRYFIAVGVITVSAGLLLGLLLSYLISIVVWQVRINEAVGPAYGAQRNLAQLAGQFPWWALVAAIAVLALLVAFVRHIGTLYRLRWYHIIAGVLVTALVAGFALSYTSLPTRAPGMHPQQDMPQGPGRHRMQMK